MNFVGKIVHYEPEEPQIENLLFYQYGAKHISEQKRTIDDLCFWIKNTDVYGAENLKSLHIFFNMTNFFRNMPSLRKTKLIIDADFGKA